MLTKPLSRRTMLRGTAGAALALPALEAMMPRNARAGGDAIPKRYIFCYAGTSSGRYSTASEGENLVPDAYGAMSDVGASMYSLQPLVDQGVLGDVSLVSNLLIPWGNDEGSLAPGGRITALDFHFGPTVTPQLSGRRAIVKGQMTGPSSEQAVVEALEPDTLFPSLSYRVQPIDYKGGNGGSAGRIAFRREGQSIVGIDPIVSPQLARDSLFSSFEPPGATPEMIAAMARRVSVLDQVSEATRELLPTLGAADRQRLERHLHEVELLEAQLGETTLDGSEACGVVADPGADPALGGVLEGTGAVGAGGWSNEDLRAEVHTNLLAMALTCDLTRYASLQYTNWKSWMSAANLGTSVWDIDIHEIGHTGAMPREAMGDVIGWHVRHFGALVRLLKDTPEWDGSSVLDHTSLVLCFEGGHGVDALDGGQSTHSTENMSVLVAGGAGGMVPGQHIDGQQRHPAQVTLSAMRAAGYTGDFGDFSNGVDELFA